MTERRVLLTSTLTLLVTASALASSFNLEREVALVMMDPRVPDVTQPQWLRSAYQDIIDTARTARLAGRQTSIDVPGNITGKNPLAIRYVSGFILSPAVDTWGDDEDIVYVTGETESPTFDPNDEAALYLGSLADSKIFFKKEIDTSSLEEVFKAAIIAEKDSIAFYLGMKDLVPGHLGKDKLDEIIKEEMKHIRILNDKLIDLKS